MSKGAPIDNGRGDDTPLLAATKAGNVEIVNLLLQHGATPTISRSWHSLLYYAMHAKSSYSLLLTELLITVGAEVGKSDANEAPSPEIFHFVQSHIVDSSAFKANALLSSCVGLEMMKFLLTKDPNLVNARDRKGETPLHIYSKRARLKEARLLIELQAEIDATDRHGKTSLYYAVSEMCSEFDECYKFDKLKDVVVMLVANGANPNAKDKDGISPLSMIFDRLQFVDKCTSYSRTKWFEFIELFLA